MSWLPKWIRYRSDENEEAHRFGRQFVQFTSPEKANHWEEALISFEEDHYLRSVEQFLEYIKYDSSDNVEWNVENSCINFSIRQGSKVIYGQADDTKVRVDCPVAKVRTPSIGLLRKLLELNYQLNYSRYSLDKNSHICLRFDSFSADGSPFKIYAAIKEVALNADKEDDLILEDFPGLEPVNIAHIQELRETEKRIKLNLFKQKIGQCLELVKDPEMNSTLHTSALAYIILDTIYRLDYLTRPEGKSMVAFEEIQKTFFSGNAEHTTEKLRAAIISLEKLSQRKDEEFINELYEVPRTFSVLDSATPEVIKGMWDSEFQHIDWYIENKQNGIARAIVGYVLGYSIFNYTLRPVFIDLIHLFYIMEEPVFFTSLGYECRFLNKKNKLVPGRFKARIKSILDHYDISSSHTDLLDFTNDAILSRSYLTMLFSIMANE